MHGLILSDGSWRWLRVAAVGLYIFWSSLLILDNPGFQYDEALMVLGSVHMLQSPGELSLPHDPDTWVCVPGFCFPLMTVRYVGAIKEYLCLPLFALFGAHGETVRIVSMLLGAVGIWGIATLIAEQISQLAGVLVAVVIAINPAYVDLTVFDNGAIATSMAALGLVCLGLQGYLRNQTTPAGFWLGAACGFGIWARANFTWLICALVLALVLAIPKSLLRIPVRHWGAWVGGGLFAGFPFLAYQVHSRGGTLQALSMFVSHTTISERLSSRWRMLSEVLLSDREHRAMWNGAEMPEWQHWTSFGIVLASIVLALVIRPAASERIRVFARIAVLIFIILAGFLFSSRLEVAEHHLVLLLPITAALTILAFAVLLLRYRRAWPVAAMLLAIYLGAAVYWQISAVLGLSRTGGVGQWSDAVYSLADYAQQHFKGREIKILDWGLQNNLYVITGGRLRSREIYPDATQAETAYRQPWTDEVRAGGLFLFNSAGNRFFPDATLGFLAALQRDHPKSTHYQAVQRQGDGYAELIDIAPDSLGALSSVSLADPAVEKQLQGFYRVEANRWRWTEPAFSITLDLPKVAVSERPVLSLQIYLPDHSIQKLGAITLSCQVNGHALPPERFDKQGQVTWRRGIDRIWLRPGPNRFDFSLDKSLSPTERDGRRLGLIVMAASLSGE